MEQLINFEWANAQLLKVGSAAILLYLFQQLLQKIIPLIVHKYKLSDKINRLFPFVEFLIWVIFIYWAIESIFTNALYYTLYFVVISLVILGWVGWFAAKDYIAGIVLRGQAAYRRGNTIQTNETRGTIKKMSYFSMEIEQEDGAILSLPYSKIAGTIHVNRDANKRTFAQVIRLQVHNRGFGKEMVEAMRKDILSSPWVVAYLNPKIKIISEQDKTMEIEIHLHTLDEKSDREIEMMLINKYVNNTQLKG